MKHQSSTYFAQQYARAMSGRGTYVTFGGTTAFVRGSQINLPALPPGTYMTDWQVKVFNGYLDHEISHLKYTDWFPSVKEKLLNQMLFSLWNMIEDVRVENRLIHDYPNTKTYLDACTQQIEYDKRDAVDQMKGPETLAQLTLELFYKEIYKNYRAADVEFVERRNLGDFAQLKSVADVLTAIPRLQDSKQSMELAKELFEVLPKDVDYTKHLKDLPEDFDQLPVIFIRIPGNGMQLSAAQVAAFENASVVFLIENDRSKTIGNILTDIANENEIVHPEVMTHDGWIGSKVLPPCGTEYDEIFVPSEQNLSSYLKVKADASAEIASLRRMLQIHLQTRSAKSWEKGLPEGVLDTEKLGELSMGNLSIFKEKKERKMIDTSAQVMVDLSGSMKSHLVRLASIMLAEALNGVPALKLSIAGFTTNDHTYPKNNGGRTVGLSIPMFKDFDEPFSSCAPRLGAIRTSNYTPLGDAYAQGFGRLIMRRERRRILWVITDGAPELQICNRTHNEYELMRQIYARCKKNNIQVVCMNIGREVGSASSHCDISCYVENASELPAALLKTMKDLVK